MAHSLRAARALAQRPSGTEIAFPSIADVLRVELIVFAPAIVVEMAVIARANEVYVMWLVDL